jgi:hypothetical protein
MRHVVTGLIITVAILGARFSSASESPAAEHPITIQIHDYSRLPADSLSSATAIVTRMYERIGVRINWVGVVRWEGGHASFERREETSHPAIARLTMIILNPKMAARGRVAPDVLGFAAVADEGMGSIAYAIYDRVRSVALEVPANEADLLGFVMAHEIGHLLLPRGSHSGAGLMRSNWDVRDLGRVDLQNLQFSTEQASQIRSTIESEARLLASATPKR